MAVDNPKSFKFGFALDGGISVFTLPGRLAFDSVLPQ